MKHSACTITAAATVVAFAQPAAAAEASGQAAPAWELTLTAYPTDVRGGENYTSAIAAANRGALHLELRVDYESVGARSAFVGWNIGGGETVTWKLTPLLGGAWGTTQAFVPGLEVSLGWRALDYYIEAEYVRKREEREDSYLYAWSELGWSARDWLRLGLVAQRTRAYGIERELQRGPFVQLKWRPITFGAYWFNPGSSEQVLVGMVGLGW